MAKVLFVSKPVAPPWNDSSKNLVRDLACHLERHQPVVLSHRGAPTLGTGITSEAVYGRGGHRYAPSTWSNGRVFGRLLLGRRHALWHFFFAPNLRSAWAAGMAARRRKVPTVQTVCSAPARGLDVRKALFADCSVVLSRHTEERLLAEGVPPDRLQRIPPPVAVLSLPSEDARTATRRAHSLPLDAGVIVYPGDLEFSGGAKRVIEVMADLPRSLGTQLVMACRPKTAQAEAAQQGLRAYAERMGVARAVHWLGETRDIHGVLGCADLVMLPAENLYAKMDLPMAIIESMYMGRAVIVGYGTPAAELSDGGGVRAVELERDVLSEAARILLEDGAQRADVGQAGRAHAERTFEPRHIATMYERLYDELIDA